MQTDTIAAIATPYGEGGIAVIRINGSNAGAIAGAIFRRAGGGDCPKLESHRVYHGLVIDSETGETIDEAVLLYFAQGRSYTGDETVEINCHGGPFVARRTLEAALAAGARPAGPGEFTRRAFAAGRIDLAQAEAVADIIAASSDRELANARMQLHGELSVKVNAAAAKLTESIAEIESRMDFPEEEDIGALPVARLAELLGESRRELAALEAGYKEGRVLKEGYRLTIVGKPNVGKSSLLNRLLGARRAIVTEEAGTTRDAIEERVVWGGTPFVIVDTAGVGRAREGSPEQLAAAESRDRMSGHASDPAGGVLLLMLDASSPLDDEDFHVLDLAAAAAKIIIFNKCDLEQKLDESQLQEKWKSETPIRISALKGSGTQALLDAIISFRRRGSRLAKSDGFLLSSARHYAAVKTSLESLDRAIDALERNQPHEIIAFELRIARESLGEIAGAHSVNDVLDIIFSRFCIGK